MVRSSRFRNQHRAISELVGQLAGIDRVAVVVAQAIGKVADQRAAGALRCDGTRREAERKPRIFSKRKVNEIADPPNHVAVASLVAAADIASFSDGPVR